MMQAYADYLDGLAAGGNVTIRSRNKRHELPGGPWLSGLAQRLVRIGPAGRKFHEEQEMVSHPSISAGRISPESRFFY